MERWVQYAFFSMFFADFTSVIAKLGLVGISANLGLAPGPPSSSCSYRCLPAWLLHEAITPAKLIGAALIIAGLVAIAHG